MQGRVVDRDADELAELRTTERRVVVDVAADRARSTDHVAGEPVDFEDVDPDLAAAQRRLDHARDECSGRHASRRPRPGVRISIIGASGKCVERSRRYSFEIIRAASMKRWSPCLSSRKARCSRASPTSIATSTSNSSLSSGVKSYFSDEQPDERAGEDAVVAELGFEEPVVDDVAEAQRAEPGLGSVELDERVDRDVDGLSPLDRIRAERVVDRLGEARRGCGRRAPEAATGCSESTGRRRQPTSRSRAATSLVVSASMPRSSMRAAAVSSRCGDALGAPLLHRFGAHHCLNARAVRLRRSCAVRGFP